MNALAGARAVALPPASGIFPACAHCGQPAPPSALFCCGGCEAAAEIINGLGLDAYYRRRVLDPAARPPQPEDTAPLDIARHASVVGDGVCEATLAIDGLQCGACVWLIEEVLARQPGIEIGRVNMTTRRLRLRWRGAPAEGARFVAAIARLGYRLVPFDAERLRAADEETDRRLLRALAVAGFAAGNVMLLSIATWIGAWQGMQASMTGLLHWISALLVLPAIAYSGRPFFSSALAALAHRRTNMDVPISIGILLIAGLSLVETMRGSPHVYFDSAATLMFFLLLGRVLDHHARAQARRSSEELLALRSTDVGVLAADGTVVRTSQDSVRPGDRLLVGIGERIGADGVIEAGRSRIDQSLVTGESLPVAAEPGGNVFAGSLNLGPALVVRAAAAGEATLLADCVRMIEAAEARRGRYVVLADRIARLYAPLVHGAAAATFLYWWLAGGAGLLAALIIAASVLIITCPCAVALAIPSVQVIAAGHLFRAGILLKSPLALERLAEVDTIVFDKTGTLTEPALALEIVTDQAALAQAAGMATASRHPLARALVAAAPPAAPPPGVEEHPGEGLSLPGPEGEIRLGSAAFCGLANTPATDPGPELWFTRPGEAPLRFGFAERLRSDAIAIIQALHAQGYRLHLLSGDRPESVAAIASACGIDDWHALCSPRAKVAHLESWAAGGRRVLMVGDGLNDAPSLAAALVSMSPATATEASQTVADVVFQGARLAPVRDTLDTARRARLVMRQNLALALLYNAVMLPIAIAGLVMPWIAAAAMSSSSLLVMANSLRLGKEKRR